MFQNTLKLNNYNYIFINEMDYCKLKQMIVDNLVSLCWGSNNNDYFSIDWVIDEFMQRFSKKDEDQQYGYIGEFLYYLYVLQNEDILKPLSLFFNQEERGFKKGFDLLGFDGQNMWYSEVKSGKLTDENINSYNLKRLSAAYRDIKNKLKYKNRNNNHWDTAKSNLCKIKFKDDKSERKQLIQILDDDQKREIIDNVIIISVVFNDSDLRLDINKIEAKYKKLKKYKKNITVVCIRKKTIEKIIDIFREVQKGNE